VSASFIYDALGRRVSKTINGVTTAYQYDRRDIIADLQGGAVLASYLRKLCLDEAFVRQTATGNEYYHSDALGSALDLTNDVGAVQTDYAYESFGRTSVTGSSTNSFQYTGRENDGIGLYYYRARYYSPMMQRFLSEDPIQLAGGINFYRYGSNNPLRFRDPLGLEPKDPNGCELTEGRTVIARIPCPPGDPTKVPPEIRPSGPGMFPGISCTVDTKCESDCLLEANAETLAECSVGCLKNMTKKKFSWQFYAGCVAGCAVKKTPAQAISCDLQCTTCDITP